MVELPKRKVQCPECGSQQIWKCGLRYTKGDKTQRYLCRRCGYRFSESNIKVNILTQASKLLHPSANLTKQVVSNRKVSIKKGFNGSLLFKSKNIRPQVSKPHIYTKNKGLNSFYHYNSDCQVCAPDKEAKNLTKVELLKDRYAGATTDVNSMIFKYLWNLQKQGYRESTVKLRNRLLRNLIKHGANLLDPESVKDVIAKYGASDGYKLQLVIAYDTLITASEIRWDPPNYRQVQKLPFIPMESEIDSLIAGMGPKASVLLQILKETGMRIGEATQLRWRDIDTKRNTITVNCPEKHSSSRAIKVSTKLIALLNSIPIKSDRVFSASTACYLKRHFYNNRKKLAVKLHNARLLNISFHTFRHWKATMEYHRTKDILHVKQLLGHRNINNTLLYTQLVSFESDEYHVKTAKTLKEACELAEAGFEYFTVMQGVQVFRKRK